MYLPNMHLPFIYNGQYAIIELLDTCKEYGASFVWIYLIAILGCFNVFFLFSWLLLFFVCLFVFVPFFKRFIILQLGNYEAVACKISLSDTVIVCHQDLQQYFVIFPVLMLLGNGVSRCHCDTLAYVLFI
jgi:hypothetical protein